MSDSAPPPWKLPQELPDGRVVEYLWTVADDLGVSAPEGHMRLLVHLLIDGEAAVVPVLLSPDDIARAFAADGDLSQPPADPHSDGSGGYQPSDQGEST